MPDETGLKAILKHNETALPNDELLNTLKAAIPQFFDKDGIFKTDKFEDELKKNNIAEAHDGYKLGFVGKDYARLQVGLKTETIIVPDYKHNSQKKNANSSNVFITGDNIDALRHLINAYENKIKLIYIDPPYNTGKEFIYNDKFEFSDEKLKSILGYSDEEITRLKSIQGKSSHSAWLTFMYPRLKIAQRLLKDDGVIFISIDDNEQANLKLLMDDIFGEENFVAEIIARTNPRGRTFDKYIAKTHEYLLVYTKESNSQSAMYEIPKGDSAIAGYNKEDEKGKYRLLELRNRNPIFNRTNRPKLYYPFYANENMTKVSIEKTKEFFIEILPQNSQGEDGCWTWGKPKANEFIDLLVPSEASTGNLRVFRKDYLIGSSLVTKSKSIWDDSEINHENGKETLGKLFGKTPFDFPKSIEYLTKCLQIGTSKNDHDIILDFFAGSATTAHAMMQLNAEDGGNRKFIMIQLDEKTPFDSEARKAGYNTIDEIARKRIELAGNIILGDYESDLVKQTNGWDKDIGFKHYRLVTPDVKTLEKIVEFNPEETNLIADDMIKPFEYKETETSGLDTILTTWLIDDGYCFDTHVEEIIFGNYKAHYVHEAATLYLINMGWDTKALKVMLNQIGTNKLLVKTIVIYSYSFEFEAMRELKTNIKTNLDNPPNLIERF
jgi:adenine-specific DNA-methyltransferase